MKIKLLSMLLCMVLIVTVFSGCGKKDVPGMGNTAEGIEVTEESKVEETVSPMPTEKLEEEVPTTYVPLASGGRGRYVESQLQKLIAGSDSYGNMQQTEEGIWVFGSSEAWFRKHGSEEFETAEYPQMIRESYVTEAAVNDDGDFVFACYEVNENGEYETILRTVKKDGTIIEMERFSRESVGPMEFGPDGKLYVHRFGGVCGIYRYELQEGEGEYLFFTTSTTEDLNFMQSKLLVLDAGQVWIYDTQTDTLQEQDTVLDDFCKENITGLGGYGGGASVACIFESVEENVVYIVNSKGVFRHVLYGSIMEQVVNGELNALSNPSTLFVGAVCVKDENDNEAFLMDFYPATLVSYTYDPDVPTVPEKMLHVYSLEDSTDLRQIIALFQQTFPECYVKYEVGLSGAGAANTEDKIKNLNTAMLGGNGPDVLVTDGLAENNYSSKGLLMDLTPLAESMTGDDILMPNLVEALKQDGAIYSLPVTFSIPMLAGEKEFVESIHDVESLTTAVETFREKNPEGMILTSSLPECILAVLAQNESANWVEDGVLKEQALKDFLSCAYRLYQAEKCGVAEGKAEEEQAVLKEAASYISPRLLTRIQNLYYKYDATLINLLMKEKQAAIGYAGNPTELRWVDQLPDGYDFAPLKTERGIGFKPVLKLAINTMTIEQELAENFVKLALSFEAGKLNIGSGIPINIAAAEYAMKDREHMMWGFSGTNEFGEEVHITAVWPLQTTLAKYWEIIESCNYVIKEDTYLMEQVIEIGAKAIQEGKTVDEAVEEIKRKTALYLAE